MKTAIVTGKYPFSSDHGTINEIIVYCVRVKPVTFMSVLSYIGRESIKLSSLIVLSELYFSTNL